MRVEGKERVGEGGKRRGGGVRKIMQMGGAQGGGAQRKGKENTSNGLRERKSDRER